MNIRSLLFLFFLTAVMGCKSATEPQPNYNFLPMTTRSHWTYSGDATFTRTVVGDTTVNGKTYAIIDQDPFNFGSIPDKYFPKRNYYRKDGNTIYVLRPDTMNVLRDCIYVNPVSGASGSYYTLTFVGGSERLVTRVTYTNTKQNFRDTVDGKIYSNVMIEHMNTEIFFPGTSSVVIEGDYYFADGVGIIDQLLTPRGTEILTSYEIK